MNHISHFTMLLTPIHFCSTIHFKIIRFPHSIFNRSLTIIMSEAKPTPLKSRSIPAKLRPSTAAPSTTFPCSTSKPKVISAIQDEVINCTFHPIISSPAHTITSEPFLDRMEKQAAKREQQHKYMQSAEEKKYMFMPQLNLEKFAESFRGKGNFQTRLSDDLMARSKNASAQLVADQSRYKYQPRITNKAQNIKSKFLTRVQADQRDRHRKQVENQQKNYFAPFQLPFQPNVSRELAHPEFYQTLIERRNGSILHSRIAQMQSELNLELPRSTTSTGTVTKRSNQN